MTSFFYQNITMFVSSHLLKLDIQYTYMYYVCASMYIVMDTHTHTYIHIERCVVYMYMYYFNCSKTSRHKIFN